MRFSCHNTVVIERHKITENSCCSQNYPKHKSKLNPEQVHAHIKREDIHTTTTVSFICMTIRIQPCKSVECMVITAIQSVISKEEIHLIPKWRSVNYSFVCMLISPLRLVNMYKKQKNFEVKMRLRGPVNQQTKE